MARKIVKATCPFCGNGQNYNVSDVKEEIFICTQCSNKFVIKLKINIEPIIYKLEEVFEEKK